MSLSSCVLKTFERMIKHRLEWWIEFNGLLPVSQFRFRKCKSVHESQTELVTDIYKGFTKNKITLALFLDFTSAYDSVQMPILTKMKLIHLSSKFIINIINLISNRFIYLKINDSIEGPQVTHIGLSQGSILSPILYSIYVANTENVLIKM